MKRIAIVENPHGGWQRGLILGLADYAAPMENWEVRQFSLRPGLALRVKSWKPDAIVCDMLNAEARKAFPRLRCPIVNTGIPETAPDLPAVCMDLAAVGRLAAEYFAKRGYRRVAFLKELNQPWWNKCEAGLRGAARAARVELLAVAMKCSTSAERRVTIGRWLRSTASPIAVCASPGLALDMAVVCRQQVRTVPEEVAILSLEDNEIECRLCVPPLSGVQPPGEQAGQLCGQLLTRLLKGKRVRPLHTLLRPGGVVERRSTDATAIHDPIVARAINLMQQHAARRTNVKELLAELSVSRRTLETRFRQALGRSPLESLHIVRMDRIRSALVDTGQSVQSVAAHFGYGSIQQFSREFRRLTGESASGFRKRHVARLVGAAGRPFAR